MDTKSPFCRSKSKMNFIKPDLCGDKLTILNKEIDLIESVITRMAQNSFYMKGWCVTLVAAIFSLSDADARENVYLPLAFMTIAFWYLDSYYLRQERAYRKLYGHVLKWRIKMGCWLGLYSLDARRMLRLVPCVSRIMFSISEWPLYLVLCVILLAFGHGNICRVCSKGSGIVKGVACSISNFRTAVKANAAEKAEDISCLRDDMSPRNRPMIKAAQNQKD